MAEIITLPKQVTERKTNYNKCSLTRQTHVSNNYVTEGGISNVSNALVSNIDSYVIEGSISKTLFMLTATEQ